MENSLCLAEQKIKQQQQLSGQQIVLAHTVLGDSICQEQQEIFISSINREFSSGSEDT